MLAPFYLSAEVYLKATENEILAVIFTIQSNRKRFETTVYDIGDFGRLEYSNVSNIVIYNLF